MLAAFGGVFSPENVEAVIRNCLLVLGGFMFGYLLGWLVGIGVHRWVLRGKGPYELQQLIRLIGGIIIAVLVALMVFGGGKGPGAGGPGGAGHGDATSTPQTSGDAPTDAKVTPKEPPPEAKKGSAEGHPEVPVVVRLLGGNNAGGVKRDLVYQLADDPAATKLNFEDLKRELLKRQTDAGQRKIRVTLESPGADEDKVPEISATKIQLERWLRQQQIAPYDR